MKWCKIFLCVFAFLFHIASQSGAYPLGDAESALAIMSQIPQWHCMRYRKFELVRRCRSYKNSSRRV